MSSRQAAALTSIMKIDRAPGLPRTSAMDRSRIVSVAVCWGIAARTAGERSATAFAAVAIVWPGASRAMSRMPLLSGQDEQIERPPELFASGRKPERRGHHAHDSERLAPTRERLVRRGPGIAEQASRQRLTDEHWIRRPRRRVFIRERPAPDGHHAQHREQPWRHALAVHRVGHTADGKEHGSASDVRLKIGKQIALIAPLAESGGTAVVGDIPIDAFDDCERVGTIVRHGTEDERVSRGKDDRVRRQGDTEEQNDERGAPPARTHAPPRPPHLIGQAVAERLCGPGS